MEVRYPIIHYLTGSEVSQKSFFNFLSNVIIIRVIKCLNDLCPCFNTTFQKSAVKFHLAGSCTFCFIVSFDFLQGKQYMLLNQYLSYKVIKYICVSYDLICTCFQQICFTGIRAFASSM